MIEKPPCFGRPCLDSRSPCHRCGVLAACGRRLTLSAPFGLLMFPRIDPPTAAGGEEMPDPLMFDTAVEGEVAAALTSVGLVQGRGRIWRFRRERVLVLREASISRTAVEFPDLGPPRVMGTAAARRGVHVGAVRSGASAPSLTTLAEMAEARDLSHSSVVWAPGWRAVVDVAVEIVTSVYYPRS